MPALVKRPQSTIYFPSKHTSGCGAVRDCCGVITVHPGKPLQLVTTPCDQHRHPPPCQKQKYLACSAFAIRDTAQQPHSYLKNVCMSGIQSLQSPRVISDEKASPDTLKLLNRCVCEISWHTQAGCLITVFVKSPDTHKPAASLLC